jgi:pSer/pThr/pTyr-binding forkhead associated (FHA) protein
VLQERAKGVPRFHAELRWEHDHYFIADLGSQNGTWTAGARIETAPLTEGVEVALGPYRLVLDPERVRAVEDRGTAPALVLPGELASDVPDRSDRSVGAEAPRSVSRPRPGDRCILSSYCPP